MATTLSTNLILMDVLQSFKKRVPALMRMSTTFNVNPLKLNKTYYAHINTLPVAESVTTTYAVTGQTARSLIVDVPVAVTNHKAVRLTQSHFDSIKDDKNKYDQVISDAGYALAKAVTDDILAGVTAANITHSATFAAADCDVDMLVGVTSALNAQGAANTGRTLILNSTAAGYLQIDNRMNSRDFLGAQITGEGYRSWTNAYGFAEILEYPDLPTTANLVGFAFDPRAIAIIAGVPDDFESDFFGGAAIPKTMGYEAITDPETGLSMAAVSWQDVGTGMKSWCPTLVWGKSVGTQGGAADTICDKAGVRIVSA